MRRLLVKREARSFMGRPGVLRTSRVAPSLWRWRIAGLHSDWRGNAESVAEALNQAAEACGMAHFEAAWREVRP